MTAHADSPPTTAEELVRKTIEFMADLEEKRLQGLADPVIASAVAKALWTVTSGLVGDLSQLLAQQADEIGPQPIKRVFVGAGKVLRLAYLPSGSGYLLQQVDPVTGQSTLMKRSDAQGAERAREIAALVSGLKTKGFTAL